MHLIPELIDVFAELTVNLKMIGYLPLAHEFLVSIVSFIDAIIVGIMAKTLKYFCKLASQKDMFLKKKVIGA